MDACFARRWNDILGSIFGWALATKSYGVVNAGVGICGIASTSGSRHSQTRQKLVSTLLPQQSPPSHSHASLLLTSSQ